MKEREHQFVICVRNGENPASLELRKIYEIIPDSKATKRNLLRVIDESVKTTSILRIFSYP